MKKLLLTITLFSCTFVFAQQIQTDRQDTKSITKVSASPNPFTTNTLISFNSKKDQIIILSIKNLLGKTVYQQQISSKKGLNTIRFYKNDLDSGMYIYAIQTDSEIVSKRLVVK